MRKMLVAAVAATMFVVVAPAFAANPATEAEEGVTPYPTSLPCHFVLQRMITESGRLVLQRHQVCD